MKRRQNNMPYGIDSKHGGDSPENVSWMERCVNGIKGVNKRTGKPYKEGEKIAICKTQLARNKEKKADLNLEITFDMDIVDRFITYRAQYIAKKQLAGLTATQAVSQFEADLARNNFNY
jgi:hypothetical protein